MTEVNTERLLYEDSVGYAVLVEKPSALGHIQVFSKKKVQSLEELDDDVVVQLFYIASYAATGVFEGLGAQGTNIIVNNGNIEGNPSNELVIDVLPRKEGDGIDFKWEPKKLAPQDMESVEKAVKDKADYIGHEKKKGDAPPVAKVSSANPIDDAPKEQINADEEDSYLIKQLTRIP